MRVWGFAVGFLLSTFPSIVAASDLEDLTREGYAVVRETRVDGEFEGCEYDRRIKFMNGMVFTCRQYRYNYAYMPEVLILAHIRTGDLKIIINDNEYRGVLRTAR